MPTILAFLSNPWKAGVIALALALAGTAAWGARVDSLRATHLADYDKLHGEAGAVLASVQIAANNPSLVWRDVPAQVVTLGNSLVTLKGSITSQNGKIEDMQAETLRLQASGDDLRNQLAASQAARASFAAKLDAMAATPGDHQSCPALLSQTTDALDLAWESGQ